MSNVRAGGAILSGLLLVAAACDDATCPPGQRQVKVQKGDGYVCLDESSADAITPPRSTVDAGNDASETIPLLPTDSGAPPAPAATCGTIDAAPNDVRVVPHDGGAPAAGDAPAPDGVYDLVQANVYGASPFVSVRATMQIDGAAIFFGGQATTGALEDNESFVVAFQPGALTKICGSENGTLATSLFPGATGDEREAHVAWSANDKLLTFVLRPDAAAYELVFAPR